MVARAGDAASPFRQPLDPAQDEVHVEIAHHTDAACPCGYCLSEAAAT